MKRIINISLGFLSAVFLVLIISSTVVTVVRKNNSHENSTTTQTQILYILGEYNGRVALFSPKSKEPMEVYGVYTDSLPYEDSSLIKKGIKIFSNEQLQTFVEDYLS